MPPPGIDQYTVGEGATDVYTDVMMHGLILALTWGAVAVHQDRRGVVQLDQASAPRHRVDGYIRTYRTGPGSRTAVSQQVLVDISLWQWALTAGFHIILPSLTEGIDTLTAARLLAGVRNFLPAAVLVIALKTVRRNCCHGRLMPLDRCLWRAGTA
jgi:hypothetical protein